MTSERKKHTNESLRVEYIGRRPAKCVVTNTDCRQSVKRQVHPYDLHSFDAQASFRGIETREESPINRHTRRDNGPGAVRTW